jgi:hypothetical protein
MALNWVIFRKKQPRTLRKGTSGSEPIQVQGPYRWQRVSSTRCLIVITLASSQPHLRVLPFVLGSSGAEVLASDKSIWNVWNLCLPVCNLHAVFKWLHLAVPNESGPVTLVLAVWILGRSICLSKCSSLLGKSWGPPVLLMELMALSWPCGHQQRGDASILLLVTPDWSVISTHFWSSPRLRGFKIQLFSKVTSL